MGLAAWMLKQAEVRKPDLSDSTTRCRKRYDPVVTDGEIKRGLWSPEEDAILVNTAAQPGGCTALDVAKQLHRRLDSVYTAANRLGVKFNGNTPGARRAARKK